MHFSFVSFNYQGADVEAEDRHYLDYHVGLAKKLPGAQIYYTARTMAPRGETPSRVRYASMGFPSAEISASGFSTPLGPALMADSEAHLKDVRTSFFEGEIIVPFDTRERGQKCFLMAAEFNLDMADLEAAEKRYREHHTSIARRLPGLRNYIIGKLGPSDDRYRIAMLAFDSVAAFKAAYASPVGAELIKDEEATIRDARVHRLDALIVL